MNEADKKLTEARGLLTDVLIEFGKSGKHTDQCAAQFYALNNRYLPHNHPARSASPVCNCVLGRIAQFLSQ